MWSKTIVSRRKEEKKRSELRRMAVYAFLCRKGLVGAATTPYD
jgi:hypothetical protein